MRHKLVRLFLVTFVGLLGFALLPHSAQASSPADIVVGIGTRPNGGNASPVTDIKINVDTVGKVVTTTGGSALRIPISYAPYNGNMLDSNNNGTTDTNHVDGLAGGSLAHIFGGTFAQKSWNNLAWCGDSQGVKLGDFELDVRIDAASDSYNGKSGRWTGYWHFETGGTSDMARGFDGTSVRVPAKNPYRTFVYFEFQEDPPPVDYTVRGEKIDSFGARAAAEYKDALVTFSSASIYTSTNNPFTFANLGRSGVQSEIRANDTADWYVAKTRLSTNAGASWGETLSSAWGIAGSHPARQTIDVQFVYQPRPSTLKAGILVKNAASYSNPCSVSGGSSRCAADTVTITRTSTDPVVSGYSAAGSGTTVSPENVLTMGNAYFGQYNINYPTLNASSGWKIAGYIVCNENEGATCFTGSGWSFVSSSSQSYSVGLNPNRTRYIYAVVEPDIKITPENVSCSNITGTVTGPITNVNVRLKLRAPESSMSWADTAYVLDGGGAIASQPSGFNFSIPDIFKDGVSRQVRAYISYTSPISGGTEMKEIDFSTTHQCPNNATCSADFSAAFNGLAGSIGQTINIPVTMRNTGSSIWANRSGGATQKVVLTSDAIPYWDVATSTTELGAGETVLPNGDKLFNISVTSKPAALTPATPLGFIMNASGGLNSNGDFGLACRTVIRMQSGYAPWLRAQNGGAVALGAMTGQTDLSRGMRKSSGARQDINKEAQFVILASLGGNRFCSSNAYDLGHGASANANCTFQGYVTNGYNLGDVNDVSNDSIYNSARKVLADASCSVSASKYNYANPASTGNMADTNTTLDWPANFPGDCPTIYGFTGNRIGPTSGSTTVRYKGGRSTLIVDGSLTITANIINQYEPTYSINPSDDLPKSLNKLPNLGIIVKGDVIVGPDVTRLDATIYATGKILTCSSYPGTTGVQTSVVAKACRNKLTVRGGLFAKGGFNFGRNFYDVAGIAARLSIAGGANAFTNPDFDYKPGDTDNPLPQGKYFGGAAEDVVGTGLNSILPPLGMTDINDQAFVSVQYLGGSFAPRF